MRRLTLLLIGILTALTLSIQSVRSQTTEFSYQGSLSTAGAPANGGYDFEFLLFDAVAGGSQLGSTIALNNVELTNGTFTVKLNFGNQFLSGANRFLEIRLRPSGQGGMTTLSPRQLVNSAPYAIKSLGASNADSATTATTALTANNALQLGGVAAGQYVVTTDPRMTDARPPAPGSPSYIQNGTSPQASSSFNISNTGSANIFNASTQYNLGGFRVLSNTGTNNMFAGVGAGVQNYAGFKNAFFGVRAGFSNDAGSNNTFVGMNAGSLNTGGARNAFVGTFAGESNTVGADNSFFGESAGKFNTDGQSNSFFGRNSGVSNTTGDQNSFFGESAGAGNITGVANSFFGFRAGVAATGGTNNSFFGREAGSANTTGSDNTFSGAFAGQLNTTGGLNAFFGHNAGASNTIGFRSSIIGAGAGQFAQGGLNSFFGSLSGANSTGGGNSFFGYRAGSLNTTGESNTFIGAETGVLNTTGCCNVFIGGSAGQTNASGESNTLIGFASSVGSNNLSYATALGAGSVAPVSNSITLGRPSGQDTVFVKGSLVLNSLSVGGITALCRNAFELVSTCSSSIRYKSNISGYRPGLDLIRKLRPISFTWIDGGMSDLGLVAEEVSEIEPLLTTANAEGEVEGVKYDRVAVVLINAIKDQQALIEAQMKILTSQTEQLRRAQAEIGALRKFLCSQTPDADICSKTVWR